MKNRILSAYPDSTFETTKSETIFIADFTKRTTKFEKSQRRGVEFLFVQPCDPNNNRREMPCFVVNNPNHQSVDYNVFDDHQFKDKYGKDVKHGECCFFPTKNDGRSWFCILEIKDCSVNQISGYKRNLAEKLESMINIFRNDVSIPNKIYFIASVPRNKTALNHALLSDYVDMKKYRRAVLVVTNSATIVDTHEIKFDL